MFNIATYEKFSNGEAIFKEGSFGDWMYFIEKGAVEIFRTVEGKKLVIANLKEGEVFGEVAYITKAARSATAAAVGNTTVGIIDRKSFDQEFNALTSDFQMILKVMATRLKVTTDVLIDLENKIK